MLDERVDGGVAASRIHQTPQPARPSLPTKSERKDQKAWKSGEGQDRLFSFGFEFNIAFAFGLVVPCLEFGDGTRGRSAGSRSRSRSWV